MSEIKEQDILKLLDGNASAKKLKKLEKWASSGKANARELELYQKIYDEAGLLSSYKKVNSKREWKFFNSLLATNVSTGDLLDYLDGSANPDQQQKVEKWKDLSQEHRNEYEVFDAILNESASLKDYQRVDESAAWESFQEALREKEQHAKMEILGTVKSSEASSTGGGVVQSLPKEIAFVPSASTDTGRTNQRWLWRSLAIAASIVLLSMFMWTLWQGNGFGFMNNNGNNLYAFFETQETPAVLRLSDGSVLSLNEFSSVTYFKDVNKIDTRSITLDGNGEFDVVSNSEKPFVVTAPMTGVGVEVIGTKFRFEDHENFVEVIENIEGSVKAYSLQDTTINVILETGDKYGFDGEKFVDIHEMEQEYEGKEYDILYILDYLMEQSGWRVTSAPYSAFDGEADIIINLEQPYEDIMEDLKTQADFDYIKLSCDGCYKVTRFLPLSE